MRLILPLLLALFGAATGVGAGLYLKPAPVPGSESENAAAAGDAHAAQPLSADSTESDGHGDTKDGGHDTVSGDTEFTKLNNQFIVPVLKDGRVVSMVVLSLSLETTLGYREKIFALEPRLRDTFLQVLFDHANMGGFDGIITSGGNMDILRRELKLAGRKLVGHDILNVLITDIARQDL
ncbi:flagellar basal body-associated FliL family protein [Aliiruegeria lutimaris]|uniref:Flagellar protein FliL n=1 Tax=Aliiruegeria lutimaris TaxID=571298 RepID=A0A1G8M454_9RHOB|nr:flagellar basal body-associated FliL family protein [Aliiruegeria lutimaris]SDI62729.1 hypothetical protein SAMN04488026_100517 [Aliiruegeria lutimaris]